MLRVFLLVCLFSVALAIVNDAEHEHVKKLNKERWAVGDAAVQKKLDELYKKHGRPPSIVHYMWDDTAFGDVGSPLIQKLRGFETPRLNKMAQFSRMYTECSCTPTRAAALTGRLAVRNQMGHIDFPITEGGLRKDEVTVAELLSDAGYTTVFFGKAHLGDIEEAYVHNQGFDEALFSVYNQAVSLWNMMAEGMNAVIGLFPEMLRPNPYSMDGSYLPKGWVMTLEGKKGQKAREWGVTESKTENKDFVASEAEFQRRAINFIRNATKHDKPFYVAVWPLLTSFIPSPKKGTRGRALLGEGIQNIVEPNVAEIMDVLKELKIDDNTLVIAMADNGPMSYHPPPGSGFAETVFRGGKGDYLEGGVRVPAMASWPGVIQDGAVIGDMIHVTDLFTTFARLGNATGGIPDDRVTDGIDQTDLILNGDTHGRRDHVFIY